MVYPAVSVVIPCFNARETIERAVKSVRIQNYSALEIVIVDDGSTDGTAELLRTLSCDDLRIVELRSREGAANARNRGMKESAGELIAFLDADDEWLAGKLHKQVARLIGEPAANFVTCASLFVPVGESVRKPLYDGCTPAEGPEAWKALLLRNFIATPSVVVRRSAIQRVGTFDRRLPVAEDQDLWIRLALDGPVLYVDEPLLVVHDRSTSLSREQWLVDQAARYTLPMIMGHLNRQRHRLARKEINRIIGDRFARSGRGIYLQNPVLGLRLIIIGSWYGFEPLQNLIFLMTAVGPVRWIRSWLARVLLT